MPGLGGDARLLPRLAGKQEYPALAGDGYLQSGDERGDLRVAADEDGSDSKPADPWEPALAISRTDKRRVYGCLDERSGPSQSP